MDTLDKLDTEKIIEKFRYELREKHIQKLIDATFTRIQAEAIFDVIKSNQNEFSL